MAMNRREFIKYGMSGLAAITVGSPLEIPSLFRSQAHAAARTIQLTIEAATVEMVDLTPVFMWVFSSPAVGPSFPGPVIFATTGDVITIRVTNALNEPHAFKIVGTQVRIGPIPPGKTKQIRFRAPAAGTYMYIDPSNAPVNRVLGLQGAMIVLPKPSRTTPYSTPTASVQQLFDDLGATAHFPGSPWSPDPASPNHRERIWFLSSVDPAFNARAQTGLPIDPIQFTEDFLPRYFTINGKSGYFSAHDEDIALSGNVGQPHLVRILNAGLATHSLHIHANHFFVTALNSKVQKNLILVDSIMVRPLDRVDWLLPFERPPDIPQVHPNNPNKLIRLDAAEELTLAFGGVPQSPLEYPMHCHMEMSQTAAGGNYPLGLLTHFTFTGDVDGVPFPV